MTLQGQIDQFRRTLTQEEKDRFALNDNDHLELTVIALVKECIELRKRIEVLES